MKLGCLLMAARSATGSAFAIHCAEPNTQLGLGRPSLLQRLAVATGNRDNSFIAVLVNESPSSKIESLSPNPSLPTKGQWTDCEKTITSFPKIVVVCFLLSQAETVSFRGQKLFVLFLHSKPPVQNTNPPMT